MKNYYNSYSGSEAGNKGGFKSALASLLENSKSKIGFAMLLILTFSQISFAQSTANYTFSTNATSSLALDLNGNAIDMTTGTTQLVGPGLDAAGSGVTNIGFSFPFMGSFYSQYSITEDGLMQFGGTSAPTNTYTIAGGTATAPRLGAFNSDMRTGITTGKIHSKLVGIAPNRTLVVELKDMTLFYTGTASPGNSTFQMRFYEATGNIEYVYGTMNVTLGLPASGTSIGFYTGAAANSFASVNFLTSTYTTTGTYTANTTPAVTGPVTNLDSSSNGSRRAYVFIPPGNAGNLVNATIAPPTSLTFTGVTAATNTLNWVASTPTANILRYAIFNSTDGGVNYNFVNSTAVGTNTLTVNGLVPNTIYTWKVYAISEGGKSTDLVGSQSTLPAGNISAIATGLWSATTTWSSGTVPTATDNVTIPVGFTVTEDVTAAAAYSLLIQGDLVYTVTTARTLTVGTNVTIDAGASIKSAATGTVLTHSLVVGGNLVNNGTIDFSTATNLAAATITFNTAGNANFTLGAGSVTNLKNAAGVTLNKGTNITNVLTFNPGGTLTVQGANALGFMVITSGLLKLDGTNTFNNPLFATNGYTIATNGGLWMNNPNATVIGLGGSPTVTGLFRMTTGIFNIGTGTGNSMGFSANSTINVEGGTINASSRFGVATAGNLLNYTQTGGTINVNIVGNTSTTLASFDLGTNAASVINFTAGTVNVVLANTAASGPRDVRGTSVFTPNYLGTAMINFGTAASGATPLTYFVSGAVPALTISTTSAIHNLSVAATNTQSFGNVTIPTGSTFNLNGFRFILRGTNVINNGTLTGTTAGSDLYFLAGTNPQSYTGVGTVTPGLISLSTDTQSNTFTIDPATSGINTLRTNLFSGTIINSNKITIGTGLALATAVQIGATGNTSPGGSFDVSPTWNLGTGTTALIYAQETAARISGFEVNPTRIVNTLSIDNANGLTIAGGDITAINTLTLTNGIVTTGANTLTVGNATTVGTLTGGSATAYVNGKLSRSIASANPNTTFVSYPIGRSGTYTPIALAPATTSIALFSAESFDSNTGTADPSIIGLSSTRRFEALPVSGTFTSINVRLSDAGIVTGNIPVQAPSATGAYSSAFGSTATFAAGPPITTTSTTPVLSANYTGYLSYANSNVCSGTPVPGATTATANSLCLGQSTTLGITTIPAGSGVTYQWQSSPDNVTYTNITGANSTTYVAVPTVSTWYQNVVTCSAGPVSGTSTPILIAFANSVVNTTPASRCGIGSVSLAATGSAGTTLNWYAAATGGNAIGTGSPFVTPSIATTTDYYVESSTSSLQSFNLGPVNDLPANLSSNATYSVFVKSLNATTINSVDIYPSTAGNLVVTLKNDAGTTVATQSFAITAAEISTTVKKTLVFTGFNMPANSNAWTLNYDIAINRGAGVYAYPYTLNGFSITGNSIDGNNITGGTRMYFYNWNLTSLVACNSPREKVTATVTTPPTFTLSSNSAIICNGQTTATPITVTSTLSDYNTYTVSPATGSTGDATVGFNFNPTVTTTYTITASQTSGSLCNNVATVIITVNPLPTAVTVSSSASIICTNNVVTLTANGGLIGIAGKIGAGTATNTASTPFRGFFGGSKTQALYTAAELTALGIFPGEKVGSIGFVAVSGTPLVLNSFTISAGFVPATTLGTNFIAGASTVVLAPVNYTPSTGNGNIDFAITTPLTWDGVSSLLIETCFNNNNGGGTSGNSISVQSSTVATGLNLYRSQDSTIDVCSNAILPTSTTTRPNLRISTLEVNPITWSPTTNLFTDAAATVPYTGTAATTVYYKSAAVTPATTYTATATSAATCTSSGTTSISTVDCEIPYANLQFPGTATITTCDSQTFYAQVYKAGVTEAAGQGAGITAWIGKNATNTDPATWAESSWQLATFNVQAGNNDEYQSTFSALAAGTYYVASRFVYTPGSFVYGGYTSTGGGIWNGTSNVSAVLTVNAVNAPVATSPQTFCNGATVANLVATGSNLQWYAASTGGTALASTTVLTSTDYFVSQTVSGCESTRTQVAVVVNTTAAPVATSPQTFCNGATVANLVATGTNLQWYAASTGGTALASTTVLTSTDYFVSQTVGGCESTRTQVAVVVNTTAAPVATSPQTFCNGATVANLVATGTNLQWYAASTGGTALASTTALTSTDYFVSQTVNGCESTRTQVSVVVNTTAAPVATSPQTFCNGATVANLVATGTNLQWYAASTGGTALASTTVLTSTDYFVSQTVNGCESTRTQVSVVVNTTAAPTATSPQALPSPATIADIVITGTNIIWYPTLADANANTNPLASTTPLVTNTTYYATQTLNGCPSTPIGVLVTVFLRNDSFDKDSLNYYPNPVTDVLNISYSNTISNIEVYNLIGQVVKTIQPNQLSTQVDMSGLPTATYLVQVTSEGKTAIIKVVKK